MPGFPRPPFRYSQRTGWREAICCEEFLTPSCRRGFRGRRRCPTGLPSRTKLQGLRGGRRFHPAQDKKGECGLDHVVDDGAVEHALPAGLRPCEFSRKRSPNPEEQGEDEAVRNQGAG